MDHCLHHDYEPKMLNLIYYFMKFTQNNVLYHYSKSLHVSSSLTIQMKIDTTSQVQSYKIWLG